MEEIKAGHLVESLRLLKDGANLDVFDEQGNTTLHYAALGGTYSHCRIAQFLLSFKADPDRANNMGMTAMHYAATKPEMLIWFVKAAYAPKIKANCPPEVKAT